LIILGTNHPWWKRIQVCSNEGEHPSLREDNGKRVKCTKFFKKSSPEQAGQFQSNLVQTILGKGNSLKER
jgi:hypothetical protein